MRATPIKAELIRGPGLIKRMPGDVHDGARDECYAVSVCHDKSTHSADRAPKGLSTREDRGPVENGNRIFRMAPVADVQCLLTHASFKPVA
jgi:hypothetical protein